MVSVLLTRKSNYELLRLVAMFIIVLYHLFLCINTVSPDLVSRAVWIPLHIGVPLFVLISGYFRIKFSWKKLIRLLALMLVYTIAIQMVAILMGGGGGYKPYMVFFVSRSPYWFMTVYLMLFVVSPYVNKVLDQLNCKEELLMLIVMAVISMYVGGLHQFAAYADGKNILNFIIIYIIGDYIKKKEDLLSKIPIWLLICVFVLLNGIEVTSYALMPNEHIQNLIWRMSYPYNAPFLIVNGVVLFLVFGRVNIISKPINWMASSCLGVYMLHSHPYVVEQLNSVVRMIIKGSSLSITVISLIVITLVIMLVAIPTDKVIQLLVNKWIINK